MVEGMYLHGERISADDPRATPLIEEELERQRRAKEEAKTWGLEVLTPQAAMSLFGISASAVRQARLGGHVNCQFRFDLTERPLYLIHLGSAVEYWQDKKRDDFDEVLEEMRENGHILGYGQIGYNVLHVKPIVRFNELGAA